MQTNRIGSGFARAAAVVLASFFVCFAHVGKVPAGQADHANEAAALALVPASVESVFCIKNRFTIKAWKNLSVASTFDMAEFFTTQLSAQALDSLNIEVGSVDCAIGACAEIRAPTPDPKTHISSGAFRSHRIEILLLSKDLPADWIASLAHRPNVHSVRVAKIDTVSFDISATSIDISGTRVLIANPAAKVLLVANDEKLLEKVVELYMRGSDDHNAVSALSQADFKAAAAFASPSHGFWGVRCFREAAGNRDPTSVRNPKSAIGFSDPAGAFVAVRVDGRDATDVFFYYASGDANASKQFASGLGKVVEEKDVSVTPAASAKLHLTVSKVNGNAAGRPPSFLGVAALFGQGLLL